jgi:acetaldehyde dehydrogenase/alcohol dehydrogenase
LGNKAKFIALPTTSGTGSEATWYTVLSDKTDRRKASLFSKEILPTVSILDPYFPSEMPKDLTISTGLDAFTQAIESYISTWHNDFSDAFAIHAIKTIQKYLPEAVERPDNLNVREKLHNAATMAGIAFNNSSVTLTHAMGHAVGAFFKLYHGYAVSIALPHCLEYSFNECTERLDELGNYLGYSSGLDLIEGIRGLQRVLGAPTSYSELIPNMNRFMDHLSLLVDHAYNDPSTVTNPKVPDKIDLETLFRKMY